MQRNGYFGIGVINMKNHINYGTLFRTAQLLDADYLFLIGKRFKKQNSDTFCSWRHMPVFEYQDFQDFNIHRPYNSQLIGIELNDNSIPIKEFKHPKQACYLLGAEDNGLTEEAISYCQSIVELPGGSFNVSVAGSIVMFDRIMKGKSWKIKN